MRAVDIIQKKRQGASLSPDEIYFLVSGFVNATLPDYQMASFLMAVFFNGMSPDELGTLTSVMLHSGKIIDLSHLDRVAIDKHSTGGVGDKVSIPLAPAVAACGVPVPMICGRGLGHTGGTLDKLESIAGFRIHLPMEEFLKQMKKIGCCLVGQTEEIAPADKKIYALRDVTATVESIPLIASSIMSKKLAEGTGGLVLDVKYGSGALMQDKADAEQLAKTMVKIGTHMKTPVVAHLTSMQQPLGVFCGNALEIQESIEILKGRGPKDIIALVVELGAEMLLLGKACSSIEMGREQIHKVLTNGKALQKWIEIVQAQGGDPRIVDNYELLPKTNTHVSFLCEQSGYLSAIDAKAIGIASMILGGGRKTMSDVIDYRVGIEMKVRIGDWVSKGEALCILHTAGHSEEAAKRRLGPAFCFSNEKIQPPALFAQRFDALSLQ